jgi:hypothetical protein
MTLIGYTCIESAEENIAPRLKALKSAGCTEIIHEYATSAGTGLATYRRPKLSRAISRLRPDDTLIVTDLACVAWSLPQLIDLLTSLRDRGIIFRALESPIDRAIIFRALESPIDTSGPNGVDILEALRAILSFNDALHRPANPQAPPAASTTKWLKVMELAARLKARRPEMSLRQVGAELKRLGYKPPYGGTEWSLATVKRLLDRAKLTGTLIEK